MKVKLLTDGGYPFGKKYIGTVVDADTKGYTKGATITLPQRELGIAQRAHTEWYYSDDEYEVVDG